MSAADRDPWVAQTPLEADEVLLVVSIDTEEDNWTPARENVTVENARQLPRVNAMFERLGLRPTYFVAHSLTTDAVASRIVRELHEAPGVEIGAHLHPWNTPPLDEPFVSHNTMLSNLPAALQRAKLEVLTDALQVCLGGARPRSFRAGRWGFGTDLIAPLIDCGYLVDSSVTPYTTWEEYEGPSHVGAPFHPYRIDRGGDVRRPGNGPLSVVPPSFGFNRSPHTFWGQVHTLLKSGVGRALMLDRIASRVGLLRHITLDPEIATLDDMMSFTRVLLRDNCRLLHVYFHSPSLCAGLTPYVRTAADVEAFYRTIEEYVHLAAGLAKIRPATVSEAANLLTAPAQTPPNADGRR